MRPVCPTACESTTCNAASNRMRSKLLLRWGDSVTASAKGGESISRRLEIILREPGRRVNAPAFRDHVGSIRATRPLGRPFDLAADFLDILTKTFGRRAGGGGKGESRGREKCEAEDEE